MWWREEQSLRDVKSPLYRDKNKKDKSLKRMSDKFQIFQTDSVSNVISFSSSPRRFLNFSYVCQLALKLH